MQISKFGLPCCYSSAMMFLWASMLSWHPCLFGLWHTIPSQTTTRLLELFQKLRELGHPHFSQSVFQHKVHCSMPIEDATAEVYC